MSEDQFEQRKIDDSLIPRDVPLLSKLEKENNGRGDIQPSVEPEIGRLLASYVHMLQAVRILELGTSCGYSTIWLANAAKQYNGKVITYDRHHRTGKEAMANFYLAKLTPYIEQRRADISEAIPALDESEEKLFDLIFHDSQKKTLPLLYEKLIKLLRPGGILIAEDTLFKGYDKVRQGLAKHTDEYNRRALNDDRLYTTIIPLAGGLTVSVKL